MEIVNMDQPRLNFTWTVLLSHSAHKFCMGVVAHCFK